MNRSIIFTYEKLKYLMTKYGKNSKFVDIIDEEIKNNRTEIN